MKTLLRIDSSLFGENSASSRLTARYAEEWLRQNPDGRVVHRHLGEDPVPHLDGAGFQSFSLEPAERDAHQSATATRSDALIRELQQADALVIGAPMYNFSISSNLKSWIDHVARAGVTFRYTSEGPQGLLDMERITVISTRGGRYAGTENDNQVPYLRQVLGFLGLDDVQFVFAEGLAGDTTALDAAQDELRALAA